MPFNSLILSLVILDFLRFQSVSEEDLDKVFND